MAKKIGNLARKKKPCEPFEKDGKKEMRCEGCNVYITVMCDSNEKKDHC